MADASSAGARNASCPISCRITSFRLPSARLPIVLVLGLINMMRGGSPNTSQRLMRLRVLLQFVAIIVIMATIWIMRGGRPPLSYAAGTARMYCFSCLGLGFFGLLLRLAEMSVTVAGPQRSAFAPADAACGVDRHRNDGGGCGDKQEAHEFLPQLADDADRIDRTPQFGSGQGRARGRHGGIEPHLHPHRRRRHDGARLRRPAQEIRSARRRPTARSTRSTP